MKKASIEKIWFEFLETKNLVDRFDCNSDVIFELNDGSKWVATFFTYQNIETLRRKNQLSGECLNGIYFCATDMILVAEMSEGSRQSAVQELLLMNEIDTYCRKLPT